MRNIYKFVVAISKCVALFLAYIDISTTSAAAQFSCSSASSSNTQASVIIGRNPNIGPTAGICFPNFRPSDDFPATNFANNGRLLVIVLPRGVGSVGVRIAFDGQNVGSVSCPGAVITGVGSRQAEVNLPEGRTCNLSFSSSNTDDRITYTGGRLTHLLSGRGHSLTSGRVIYNALTMVPLVTIDTDTTDTNGTPFLATFTFSEDVSGFELADINAALVNGTASAFMTLNTNRVFSAMISPDGGGDILVGLNAGAARDDFLNDSRAATTRRINLDTDSPNVIISGIPTSTNGSASFVSTFTFNEPVTDFDDAVDVIATNATVGPITAISGTVYSAQITPNGVGDITVNVPANAARDAANNGNIASAPATTTLDNMAPSVAFLGAPASHDQSTPFTLTIEFSEDVLNFLMNDVTAINATLSNFVAVDGNTYTVDVFPTGPQDIMLGVAAGAAQDLGGNNNVAAAPLVVRSNIVEQTQEIIATFLLNRANHLLSNQADLIGFVTGSNTRGGGPLGNLALSANQGSQVLAFSTSRSKILAEMNRSKLEEELGASVEQATDPLALLALRNHGNTEGTRGQGRTLLQNEASHALGGEQANVLFNGAGLIAEQRQAAATLKFDGAAEVTAPGRSGTWDIWTEIYGSASNSDTSDSSLWVGYIGAHYFVTDYTLVGVLGQIDSAEESNSVFNSSAEGTGWLIGPYIAGQLPGHNLFYEARTSWGTSDNEVSTIGTFSDSFNTTRFLASGKLSGSYQVDDYRISPEVSVSYFEETQESYTDSLANLIPEQTISLGEVRFGPDISRRVELADGTLFEPSVGISGVYNFGIKDNIASQGFSLGDDDVRARVDLGFSATNSNGTIFSAEGFYDGIGADDFNSYGGRLRLTVPLN